MFTRIKQHISFVLSLACLLFPGCSSSPDAGQAEDVTVNYDPVTHEIAAGDVSAVNPLKGLVPYIGDACEFGHSLKWFYIPVKNVQTGMNTFDWTALEDRLNEAAESGCQAVFRFYFDYPGSESGVPQFLIDAGLEMRSYDEPDALGGGGLTPNYSDAMFRESMKNFIAAFGERYDGDPRIGFITLGLLGFWGEWHNWPLDEQYPDYWAIDRRTYREIIAAYDDAFNVTKLCLREPKDGIRNIDYNIGYHDDSFGYSTLSAESGGQFWSFCQKLLNHDVSDRWMTECIGGEVYPQIQSIIFEDVPVYPDWIDETGIQDVTACIAEAHPTWLICDAIKNYSGSVKENAEDAVRQMGYDLSVTSAVFADNLNGESLELQISMKNSGVAPFYYDHTVWPVIIGLIQDDNVILSCETEWDLSSVPADGTDVTFSHTFEDLDGADGKYELCIRVKNPLDDGLPLLFSNEGQGSDGWLKLGDITISSAK